MLGCDAKCASAVILSDSWAMLTQLWMDSIIKHFGVHEVFPHKHWNLTLQQKTVSFMMIALLSAKKFVVTCMKFVVVVTILEHFYMTML